VGKSLPLTNLLRVYDKRFRHKPCHKQLKTNSARFTLRGMPRPHGELKRAILDTLADAGWHQAPEIAPYIPTQVYNA